MPKLSVTLITMNESGRIAPALESVSWADEIVVVDAHSTDDTVEQARRFTDRVITRDWPGYVAQKNYAAAIASHDWVLSLDADERVTPELADQVRHLLTTDPPHAGYRVPRVTFYLGRWWRTTDWYPDHQLRLYDRRRAAWQGRHVHESVRATGRTGRLTGELQHLAYRDVSHHLETIDRYTTLAARQLLEDGTRASWIDLVAHPPAAFLRNYLLRRGILDGTPGLIVSGLNAYYVWLKYVKLWEMQKPR